MKYVIILPDGCADEPIFSLGNLTALQKARLPHMDEIARTGILGRSNNTPKSLPAGSDVATMSVLGYDPTIFYTGRAPLEAAATGISLGENDWAIRCNFVTIQNEIMKSFNAGQICSEDAAELIETLNEKLGGDTLEFYAGVSYRNLIVWRHTSDFSVPFREGSTHTFPPHDFSDQNLQNAYPSGAGSREMKRLMEDAHKILSDHPVNRRRMAAGELPATDIWTWGEGKRPNFTPFKKRFGVQGAMISAVNLLFGLGEYLGWENIQVPGATGYADTNYEGKMEAALSALQRVDLVCVHVEAPDEAGHDGDAEVKVRALEAIDEKIVGPVHRWLKTHGDYRILVTPDHPTPVRLKTHTHGDVPWVMCGTGIIPDQATHYNEIAAENASVILPEGHRLMEHFIFTR
ncbi:MAG: cofactor-independent phosphoglycerate mutase [Planctomycetia bacterium]|nr:cofactor-independent phosphoglycerate mutase [Planctomycetia bacterium]